MNKNIKIKILSLYVYHPINEFHLLKGIAKQNGNFHDLFLKKSSCT